ncbi:recombinase RecT [Parapedobacter indicus]|uniref:Recombination protein RecT n=1 Tax=Parapedobacter indicus TaxID=1477437 RepID=A0A1I3E0A0_9SPHI|nr:recombinase RecT [Parapedobacter indicus]PPL04916.1 recombination protein RecT [Parapedobacter indicus]SFH92396.1 recombination protein RecT [Parapedobacter indicus]
MSNQQQQTGVQKAPQQTPSERFTAAVMKEFAAVVGDVSRVTNFQKKVIQNYFIKLDMVLKAADQKRLDKNAKAKAPEDQDHLEYSWNNINMQQLALDVISYSVIGLDPLQKNHINLIPYKNNKTEKYDITFMMGYDGIELKARKYGYDIPDDVIIELVYSNDHFKVHKKSKDNPVESYEFDVVDAFDRGDIVGGFYYHVYHSNPEKNKLRVYTKAQIDKRKPKYASVEFWGGEKDKWEYDKAKNRNVKVGKEEVEGWYEEMAWKTLKRAAYDAITIDSEKIDEHYLKAIQAEREMDSDPVSSQVAKDINQNANRKEMSFEDAEVVEDKAQELPSATEKVTMPTSAQQPEKQPAANKQNPAAGMQPSFSFDD